MKLFLDITLYIFIAIAGISLIAYFPRIWCWFFAKKPQKRLTNNKKNKIAVIVPARNESKVIKDLLDSLDNQTYEKENFDVHIIVKEESDPTIKICEKRKIKCHIVPTQKCKGDALDACLKDIMKNSPTLYDAYLIIDADCLMDKNCLKEFNNALASGRQIIQAKKFVKNYESTNKKANSLSAECNGLIWTIIDDLGNRYKSEHNITNMTIGTGVMFRADVIQEIGGWPYRKTVTEDMEFMNDAMVRGFTTLYYSYAKIYMEEATSLKMTNFRRTRWMTGLIEAKRIYNKQVNQKARNKETRKNKYYIHALWPLYWYIGSCTVFAIIEFVFSIVLAIFGSPLWSYALILSAIGLTIIYLSFLILTIFCLIVDGNNIKLPWYKKTLLLFAHPIFYMGYIRIVAKALLGKSEQKWETIERIDFEEVEAK